MYPDTLLARTLLQQRLARANAQQPPPDMAPPPYSESSDSDNDDDGDEDEDDDNDTDNAQQQPNNPPRSQPMKLLINSATRIHGSNNLVPTSPSPLADASRFSTILLQAVNSINNAHLAANSDSPRSRRPLRLDLTINCGITVIGDRNVVGNVGLKPKSLNAANAGAGGVPGAVVGAKRKADDATAGQGEGEPAMKKLSLDEGRE